MNHGEAAADTTAAVLRGDEVSREEEGRRLRERVYLRQREIERFRNHGQWQLRARDVLWFGGAQLLLLTAAAIAARPLLSLAEFAAFQSWQETVCGALLLAVLSLPVTLFVADVLVGCLWDAPVARRAGLLSLPALFCWITIVLQWWGLGEWMVGPFVCTTVLTAFLPGMALRYTSRWRLRAMGAVKASRHSRASTIELALLTALVAFVLVLYRAWFFIQGSWPLTAEDWQLVLMFGLLPIMTVSVAGYCSLRATAGGRWYLWAVWGLSGGLIAGAVVPVLSKQLQVIDPRGSWPLPGSVSDVVVQAIPAGLLVTFAAHLVAWTFYWVTLEKVEHLTLSAGGVPKTDEGGVVLGSEQGGDGV